MDQFTDVKVKIKGTIPEGVLPRDFAQGIWKDLCGHRVILLEVKIANRKEPAAPEEGEKTKPHEVELEIVQCEFAIKDFQEDLLRPVIAEMYQARTGANAIPGMEHVDSSGQTAAQRRRQRMQAVDE